MLVLFAWNSKKLIACLVSCSNLHARKLLASKGSRTHPPHPSNSVRTTCLIGAHRFEVLEETCKGFGELFLGQLEEVYREWTLGIRPALMLWTGHLSVL